MKRPENLLFRSRIEIIRLMQVLAQEKCRISAEIKNGHAFSSYIIAFDPATERFAIAFSPHKQLNAMLIDSPVVEFTATDKQELHFTFEAISPEEAKIEGEHAVLYPMPKMVLLHNRREHARISIPADVSLRCIADEAGFIPFESHVTDISHDGMGCLIYDPEIILEAGTILKGCRIITPGGDAVVADMELRHITSTKLADGSLARRAGFRFVQMTEQQNKLVNIFIQDLDKK
jgi:c-di-GMP-binding flagellar brake protein YcgR